jgi:hypothetical protein
MKERSGWKGVRYQEKGLSREAGQVLGVKVELEYLNANYELELLPGNKTAEQGLLLCGKLKPKQPSLPEFWLRWDEKGDHLNVDIVADQERRYDWQNETNGYKGHRPQKASDYPGRAFRLSIAIPESNIFKGIISFNLARNVEVSATIGLSTERAERCGSVTEGSGGR